MHATKKRHTRLTRCWVSKAKVSATREGKGAELDHMFQRRSGFIINFLIKMLVESNCSATNPFIFQGSGGCCVSLAKK